MRNRDGFTLIELLIVVVIIGILAAIALPKFGATREAAYYTTMKADLNNLRTAQEMYYQTTGDFNYASDIANLEYQPSNGVTVAVSGGGQSYSATAVHSALGNVGCAMSIGAGAVTIPGGAALTTEQQDAGAPFCADANPS